MKLRCHASQFSTADIVRLGDEKVTDLHSSACNLLFQSGTITIGFQYQEHQTSSNFLKGGTRCHQ